LWSVKMVFWCRLFLDGQHCFELIWWVFRFQLSQKRLTRSIPGDYFTRRSPKKTREGYARLSKTFSMQKSCGDPSQNRRQ
jgi:hypothetical protein